MKSGRIYLLMLAISLGACTASRPLAQGDEYDDVYFSSTKASQNTLVVTDNNKRVATENGLSAEAYYSEYDQRPVNNYANPDANDYPVGNSIGSGNYFPIDNQNANWNNYNSWNNGGWGNCWNCNTWGGGGWNTWNSSYYYNSWNYNSWNRPWGWNAWNNPYNLWGSGMYVGYGWGWNSWNRPWGWNAWNNPYNSWGWGGNNGWIDNRQPTKIQVGPRTSGGRGSSLVRNTPNPRLQNNNNNTNPDANSGGRVVSTSGGRTRNVAANTYNATQSNEIHSGRTRTSNSNAERYSGRENNSGSIGSGRNNSNPSSSWSSGRNNSNSSSVSSGRSNSGSSSSWSSGRSSSSSSGSRSSSSGGRSGGRGGR